MLMNTSQLKGQTVRALDGELGTIEQFYFDDDSWAIRYFVVNTGSWLAGRHVLISPFSVTHTDWQARRLDVALTKEQVENSPGIDTQRPVSRQHEAENLGYYSYPYYWDGPNLWGAGFSPVSSPLLGATAREAIADGVRRASTDSHLRSSAEVTGYSMESTNGEIGHLDGFIVDDETWAIRYIEVATRNWWPGKKVLVSPAWIELVNWETSKVVIGLSREDIRSGPEYLESVPVNRDYENQLYFHYGLPPYWLNEAEHQTSFSMSSV